MIRRADGSDWLILSQVDHAHLAGDMAQVWGSDAVPPLPFPEALVPAVRDHDDGWIAWEEQPRVDAITGQPRNFTEMPMQEATAIWSRSIAGCARGSLLGGIWTSLHFCWLGERANTADAQEAGIVQRFLADQAKQRAVWRDSLEAEMPDEELDRLIDQGLGYLQLFDSISLWLCCSPATASWMIALPNGDTLTFEPRTLSVVQVKPYPFTLAEVRLSAPARRIAARPYGSDRELQSALRDAPEDQLQWTLQVGEAKRSASPGESR